MPSVILMHFWKKLNSLIVVSQNTFYCLFWGQNIKRVLSKKQYRFVLLVCIKNLLLKTADCAVEDRKSWFDPVHVRTSVSVLLKHLVVIKPDDSGAKTNMISLKNLSKRGKFWRKTTRNKFPFWTREENSPIIKYFDNEQHGVRLNQFYHQTVTLSLTSIWL